MVSVSLNHNVSETDFLSFFGYRVKLEVILYCTFGILSLEPGAWDGSGICFFVLLPEEVNEYFPKHCTTVVCATNEITVNIEKNIGVAR
jgi:hypothetical protein